MDVLRDNMKMRFWLQDNAALFPEDKHMHYAIAHNRSWCFDSLRDISDFFIASGLPPVPGYENPAAQAYPGPQA